MKRRRVLATLGAGFSVAGCLSDGSTPNGTDPDTPDNTDTAFSIGATDDDVGAHGLTVRNAGDSSRIVELRIGDAETGETLLDRSYSLADGGEISGELREPAEYEVRIDVPEGGTGHVTTVGYFDTCNEYETIVTITADGTITSETLRTDLECSSG